MSPSADGWINRSGLPVLWDGSQPAIQRNGSLSLAQVPVGSSADLVN